MRKFLLGILCGVLLAGVLVVVLSLALVRLGDRPPAVPANAVLNLKLEGVIGETATAEIPFPFGDGVAPPTMHEVWTALRAAAKDDRIKMIALRPRGVGLGWGKLQELHSALREFRKSGKPVLAWLANPGAREYYLATAADKIYFVEEDRLDLKGVRAELTYYKGTLDKLGVTFEVEHMGKYKDAGDVYSRTSSTPETREVINSILDGVYNDLIAKVAEGRKMDPAAVRKLIDDGPFLAPQALKSGLIDGLIYEDQFKAEVEKRNGGSSPTVSLRTYAREAISNQSGPKIALVTGEGSILRGGTDSFGADQLILSENFSKVLRDVAADAAIKGVIVRVDSPGGDAIASDDILREMKLLRQKKPVVISMSDVAASGGYYIAATGDPIVAYPNTITGSIGVVYGKPNLKGLYDKIGVTKEIMTRGRYADVDSSYGPMTDAARAKLREGLQLTYDVFLRRVADARGTKPEAIEPLAQGRAWLGSQAHANKLVDHLGGFEKSVSLIKEKAKIATSAEIQLIAYPPRQSFLEKYLMRTPEATANTLVHQRVRALLAERDLTLPPASLLRGGVLRLMPYTLEIK